MLALSASTILMHSATAILSRCIWLCNLGQSVELQKQRGYIICCVLSCTLVALGFLTRTSSCFGAVMEALNRLSSDNVDEVAAEVLGSKLRDDFQALAQQVCFRQNL